jgi:hypothetical protein
MQKKIAPTDIHECLLKVYGDQTENVTTMGQWVDKRETGGPAQRSPHETKNASISSSKQISGFANLQNIVVIALRKCVAFTRAAFMSAARTGKNAWLVVMTMCNETL